RFVCFNDPSCVAANDQDRVCGAVENPMPAFFAGPDLGMALPQLGNRARHMTEQPVEVLQNISQLVAALHGNGVAVRMLKIGAGRAKALPQFQNWGQYGQTKNNHGDSGDGERDRERNQSNPEEKTLELRIDRGGIEPRCQDIWRADLLLRPDYIQSRQVF